MSIAIFVMLVILLVVLLNLNFVISLRCLLVRIV